VVEINDFLNIGGGVKMVDNTKESYYHMWYVGGGGRRIKKWDEDYFLTICKISELQLGEKSILTIKLYTSSVFL
jgi:hypothetical protein